MTYDCTTSTKIILYEAKGSVAIEEVKRIVELYHSKYKPKDILKRYIHELKRKTPEFNKKTSSEDVFMMMPKQSNKGIVINEKRKK